MQGISPRGNKGPRSSGEIWALAGGDAQQQGVKSGGTKTGSGEKEPFAEGIKQVQEVVGGKKIILQVVNCWCKTSSFGEMTG